MTISIDGIPVLLPPLVAAMVAHLIEHQQEIIRYETGHIDLDYQVLQKQVVFALKPVLRSVKKLSIDKHGDFSV